MCVYKREFIGKVDYMDIKKRARLLRLLLAKEAAFNTPTIPKVPSPPSLFNRLEGPNKPPDLTSPSQPKIDITKVSTPTLPKMNVEGKNPKYVDPLKTNNPYNKI